MRAGNTGVGYTLETLLGLEENNISLSDLQVAELKAKRENASSLVSLFTRDKAAWKVSPRTAIEDFGTIDSSGRHNLYCTIFHGSTGDKFNIAIDSEGVSVIHRDGTIVARWSHVSLAEAFKQKFPALMLVTAEAEFREGIEWFRYNSAELYTGTSDIQFQNCFSRGLISIDFRLHLNGARVRNRGTAFRIAEHDLPKLFANCHAI